MPRGRKKAVVTVDDIVNTMTHVPNAGTDLPVLGIDIPAIKIAAGPTDPGSQSGTHVSGPFTYKDGGWMDARDAFVRDLAVQILLKAVEDKVYLRSEDAPKYAFQRATELADLLGV